MKTKACVYCGCDVTCDDAIASYMEFQDDIQYMFCNPYDGIELTLDGFYSTLWINTYIPPRNEYADVYALCLDCCERVLEMQDML